MSKPRIIKVPLKSLLTDPHQHYRPGFDAYTALIALPMIRPYDNRLSFHPVTRMAQRFFPRTFDPNLLNWRTGISNSFYRLVQDGWTPHGFYLLTMPHYTRETPGLIHPRFAHKKHPHPSMFRIDPTLLPQWDRHLYNGFGSIGRERECFIPWLPWDRGNDIKPSDMPDLFPRLYHRATFFHP